MILRKDNPNFVDYVSEFNNTVNLFMLKPDHQQDVISLRPQSSKPLFVSLRPHKQQSQQVASNQHQASFIVSLRFYQHRASIQHRMSLRFIPHKKPQLRCWRRPLMVRQPQNKMVTSDVSVPYKGNRRGRKDY